MRLLKIFIYLQLKEFSFFEQFSLRRVLKDNFTRLTGNFTIQGTF